MYYYSLHPHRHYILTNYNAFHCTEASFISRNEFLETFLVETTQFCSFTFLMAGGGRSMCIAESSPAKRHAANWHACPLSKKWSFCVSKYAPVIKSCVAAISSSPFLGVTRLDLFWKIQNREAELTDSIKLLRNGGHNEEIL